jgi:two-component system CheB/CheR fusion protein
MGIPTDQLEAIFELFVQSHDSLDRTEGGMGVGLTLVRSLVQLHGGRVQAFSRGLGKGAEFVVHLPCCEADQPAPAPPPSPPVGEAAVARVLIVEDNDDSRQMLQMLLRLDGHQVTAAADGISGLRALEKQEFDVAFVDIGLPGLDGYEIARRTRARQSPIRPRLVALTGYGQAADREAVRQAGFDEHLVKPLNPEDLSRILKKPR